MRLKENCISLELSQGKRVVVDVDSDMQKYKWYAEISFDGKRLYLGCFKTQEDAALAYDSASIKYHGIFGRRNFI